MYDYVIVGAGTAGCLVANRLSEREDCRVLLIEQGGADARPDMAVPAAWPALQQDRSLVELGLSAPEPTLSGRRVPFLYGRVLGGASSINNVTYERPTRSDFESWVAVGGATWTFDAIEQALERVERDTGDTGMRVETVRPSDRTQIFLDCVRRAPAGGHVMEVGSLRVNTLDGRRRSSASAFLKPIAARPNLSVVLDARVERIVVEASAARAIEYVHGGKRIRADAAREIVLCAGALGSPKLLMLSGIGAADSLRRLGIPVVVDLPGVGENLQDHVMIPNVYAARDHARIDPGSPHAEARALIQLTRSTDTRPDVIVFFGANMAPLGHTEAGPPPPGYGFVVGAMRTTSRGSVRLVANDPAAQVELRTNMLQDRAEIRSLAEALAWTRELAADPAFDRVRVAEVAPGVEDVRSTDVTELVCRSALPFLHYCGTCAIGRDELAVVSPELRVRGIDQLRVIDASVMPTLVAAPTLATTLAIAEIGAVMMTSAVT